MDNMIILPTEPVVINQGIDYKPFIEANTEHADLEDIRHKHIIPVFAKNNEPAISQVEFIQVMGEVAEDMFQTFMTPVEIRVSHPIKGRIPSARNKPAQDLLPYEKTLYYERCAFLFRFPAISRTIGGKEMHLTVGGIKAYNLDNLNRYGGTPQVFKIFIGFQVRVCCNLCIFTDGSHDQVKAANHKQLAQAIQQLFLGFDAERQYRQLRALENDGLTDAQFARLIGRARMYQSMPNDMRKEIFPLLLSDSQINNVVRGYYHDTHFGIMEQELSFWNLYNLMTTASKGSYIDNFVQRNCNALDLTAHLMKDRESWFLN